MFDLGGVLVELSGFSKLMGWMRNPVSEKEFWKRWLMSPSVRSYERGLIDTEKFAEELIQEFNLNISNADFLVDYRYMPKRMFEGANELLTELSSMYNLALLSNTNELHWDKVTSEDEVDKIIKKHFLSFKIGMIKPDREIFEYVVCELGGDASRIMFFDDNLINVEAAKQVGIHAHHVVGFENLKEKLRELKIWGIV